MKLRLPSPSMAVAVTALAVGLGGTSYAAVTISGQNVKNSSLTGLDVRNSSLTGTDIKNRSLSASDFAAGALPKGAKGDTGAAGSTGATGAQGPKGDKGDKGDKGAPGTGRWALVNDQGVIERQSGGFTVVAGYPTTPDAANGNVYIDAGEDLTGKGIVATIALQNQVEQNGDTIKNGTSPDADDNPEFAGEISATQCQLAGIVECAPPEAKNNRSLVVSPRNSDGTRTADGSRKRFYVTVVG